MGVDSKHPLYIDFIDDWEQLRDTYRSERVVKERGFRYLPTTAGMRVDGIVSPEQDGWKAYVAYRTRARFPDLVKDAVESMLGVMHHKPPMIELPAALEPLRDRATLRNESLVALLRRINEEQLVMGRLGMLLDVPERLGATLPYIAMYQAEHIINWDEGERDIAEVEALNLVTLDESENERVSQFEWGLVKKYRVLVLGDVDANEVSGVYRVGVFRDDTNFSEAALVTPSIAGRTLDRVPFVFVNTKDIVPEPDDGPMLGLSNLALTIYRGEADYRQALFMQGQDTLVTIGAIGSDDIARRVGAGAEIPLPIGGDAKFIGVDSAGIPEMRQALENDYTRGEQRANGLLEAVSRSAESGEALRVRVAARTASLNQIAMTGAFALQEILRIAAVWVGANPDEVVVKPNTDFVADILKGQELTQIMTAKGLGAPISLETIHEIIQQRGLSDLDWEEELERMEREAELGLPGSQAMGVNDDAGASDGGAPLTPEEEAAARAAEEADAEAASADG